MSAKLDVDHDIPDGLGFDKAGTRYIDKDLFRLILSGEADTGLDPLQVIECLSANIDTEQALAKQHPDWPWHEVSLAAHKAEATKVTALGGNLDQYDQALAPLFIACKQKQPKNLPQDLVDLETSHVQRAAADDGRAEPPETEPAGGDEPSPDDNAGGRAPVQPS